jgi:predicted Fe-Mo cluster-binding NifX family protein
VVGDRRKSMRIAISTDSDMVAPHFGRCQPYTIAGVSGTVRDALEALKRGDLRTGESTCEHADEHTFSTTTS